MADTNERRFLAPRAWTADGWADDVLLVADEVVTGFGRLGSVIDGVTNTPPRGSDCR